jgi:hypothetical protein
MNPILKSWIPKPVRFSLRRTQAFLTDYPKFRHSVAEAWPREEFFRRAFVALVENGIGGDYLEFGCHGGLTFGLAYRYARRAGHGARFWAFDSFEGLPASSDPRDAHPLWQPGKFRTSLREFEEICAMRGIPRDRYETIAGFYSETLSPNAANYDRLPTDVALAYVDCDLYTSSKSVLDFLAPRLKHGMILAFDDYFAHSSSAVSGERLAFLELQEAATSFGFLPYIQYGTMATSFIVEKRELLLS